MQIVKQGNPEKIEENKELNFEFYRMGTRGFGCPICGCGFWANPNEYIFASTRKARNGFYRLYLSQCPQCFCTARLMEIVSEREK